MSPLFHPVTQFNQGQPCRLHAQEVQPDTVEVHFGFESAPITPCNINYNPSETERSTEKHDVGSRQGNTNNNVVAINDAPAASPAAGNASALVQANAALVDAIGKEIRTNSVPGKRAGNNG